MKDAPAPARPREFALLLAGLLALAAAQLFIAGAFPLFGRHFWLDELFTHALVTDPSIDHSMRALAGGVETHPPTFYFLLRAWGLVFGTGEVALRSFAFAAILAALLGLYATLRLAYAPFVAVAAVLAVWSHPLVLFHAFEARFYAPWLALTAWFAYLVVRSQAPAPSRRTAAFLGLTALLLCTTHYFGVISFGLVVGAALLASPLSFRARCRRLLPAAAGPVALFGCLPLLLGQRRALTAATWVKPLSAAGLEHFLLALAPWPPYTLLLAAGLVVLLWGAWRARRARGAPVRLVPLTLAALGLMPLVLIAFSVAVQPVTEDRYAMPAVAVFAAAAAVLAARVARPLTAVACAVLLALGTWQLHNMAAASAASDGRVDRLTAVLRARTDGDPVAFEHTHELYPVCHYAPDLAGRCVCLDFSDAEIKSRQTGEPEDFDKFVRDLHRRYVAFYGRPGLISWADYRALPRRYLVPAFDQLEGVKGVTPRYPGFVVEPVERELYQLTEVPGQ